VVEADMVAAIEFGYDNVKAILDAISELVAKAGKPKVDGERLLPSAEVTAEVKRLCETDLLAARRIKSKNERGEKVDALRDAVLKNHFTLKEDGTPGQFTESLKRKTQAKEAFKRLEEKLTRRLIVESGTRADGRDATQIRPIESQVGVFARTHGSSFFQRGETQSLVSCTLGTAKDEQIIDGLIAEYSKKFTLHYNFPPFATGEAKRITGPGRREIGHGALAERSLMGILPSPEEFPYTIRIVSDITESNGSSSMASVCGGCLALMDAGVPIKATCAGISVGRFADDNDQNEVFVTDIIGEEDFFGDMDFKVSGTREGITGIQLDLKTRGLKLPQIVKIFEQAKTGRLQIIDIMEQTLAAPRPQISPLAPRLVTIKIDPEKIGKLIGPGGKMIRGLQEKWGVTIDVEDDGTVMVAAPNGDAIDGAKAEIEALCEEIKVGTIYTGKVVSTKDFGAFVEIASGTDGMCHISELAEGYVKAVGDVVRVGDIVKVKVVMIDDQGRIKLSRKAAMVAEGVPAGAMAAGEVLTGVPGSEPPGGGHGGGHGGGGGGGRGRGRDRGDRR
jgi:polyribonucleotide nucleotidyltransferase